MCAKCHFVLALRNVRNDFSVCGFFVRCLWPKIFNTFVGKLKKQKMYRITNFVSFNFGVTIVLMILLKCIDCYVLEQPPSEENWHTTAVTATQTNSAPISTTTLTDATMPTKNVSTTDDIFNDLLPKINNIIDLIEFTIGDNESNDALDSEYGNLIRF